MVCADRWDGIFFGFPFQTERNALYFIQDGEENEKGMENRYKDREKIGGVV